MLQSDSLANDTVANKPVEKDAIDSPSAEEEVVESPETIAPKEGESIELPEMLQSRRNLIFSTFIILALFLTVVISFNRSVVNKVIRSILNDNYLNLLYREQRGRWSMQFVFLYIFFVANMALFLFLMIDIWDFEKVSANLLYLCGIIGAIYFCRHLSLRFIGDTFPISKETGQFNFTIMLFNIFLGLILLPINLFIAFAPASIANTFLYIGLGVIVLFYLLRQLRGLFIGARFIMHNKFHFLLYLCTVEIAPMAVLFEFFQPYFI
jgi:cation transport ATPase